MRERERERERESEREEKHREVRGSSYRLEEFIGFRHVFNV
jgi:hypothetical protein